MCQIDSSNTAAVQSQPQTPERSRSRCAIAGPRLQHPAPYSLIGDVEPTLGEQVLHISVAQSEAQLKPDNLVDDNR